MITKSAVAEEWAVGVQVLTWISAAQSVICRWMQVFKYFVTHEEMSTEMVSKHIETFTEI